MSEKQAWSSRKYKTAWYLTALTTITLAVPYAVSIFIQGVEGLITGAQWLTFLFGIWSIYFGANVAEKAKIFQEPPQKKTTDLLADDKDGE